MIHMMVDLLMDQMYDVIRPWFSHMCSIRFLKQRGLAHNCTLKLHLIDSMLRFLR